jgi:hypothetical protein
MSDPANSSLDVAHTVQTCRMRASASSPNLALVQQAASSSSDSSNGSWQQEQQQQQEQQDGGGQLVPSHSSRSVGDLSHTWPLRAGAPGTKSRFGRPAGGSSSSSGAALPGEAPFSEQADACESCAALQWGEEQQQQEQQQAGPAGMRDCAGTSSSGGGGAGAHRWTFSRCNSEYGGSEAWGREWRIHCVTFNMGGKLPDSLPDALLGRVSTGSGAGQLPDVLVVATQVWRGATLMAATALHVHRRA